jgi:hypothetical protein
MADSGIPSSSIHSNGEKNDRINWNVERLWHEDILQKLNDRERPLIFAVKWWDMALTLTQLIPTRYPGVRRPEGVRLHLALTPDAPVVC